MKRSLHIGIDYRNTDAFLPSCVLDSKRWQSILGEAGYSTNLLIEEQATKMGMVNAMLSSLEGMGVKDELVITYSGHGSQVPDLNGDETDRKDECLVPIDYLKGHFLTDDEINWIFGQSKCKIIFIVDSCHSGTISKFLPLKPNKDIRVRSIEFPKGIVVSKILGNADMRKNVLVISGCQDHEFSYDTGNGGALSNALMHLLKTKGRETTWKMLFNDLKNILPSPSLPQNPKMTCKGTFFKNIKNEKIGF